MLYASVVNLSWGCGRAKNGGKCSVPSDSEVKTAWK